MLQRAAFVLRTNLDLACFLSVVASFEPSGCAVSCQETIARATLVVTSWFSGSSSQLIQIQCLDSVVRRVV